MSRSGPTAIRRALVGLAAVMLVAMGMSIPATALASEPTNLVLVWNENAVSVIGNAPTATAPGLGQAPPLSALSLAMVHGAIYDAVNAIDKGHQPYLGGLSAPSTASKAAAVVQAAHDVLLHLVATTPQAVIDRVDLLRDQSLALIDPGQSKEDGRTIGAAAAAAMIAARSTDGRFDSEPWPMGDEPGEWVPVAPLSNNVFGQFATVKPLTMKSPGQFRSEGPPALTSPEYAAEFNEVKALGAQSGSSRTAAQTLMAGFYTANPFVFYNTGLRQISTAKGLSTTQEALLFAKTSMASADALIGCFNNKAVYTSWRPQTAIRASGQRRQSGDLAGRHVARRSSQRRATRISPPATTATRPASGTAPGCTSGPTSTPSS